MARTTKRRSRTTGTAQVISARQSRTLEKNLFYIILLLSLLIMAFSYSV